MPCGFTRILVVLMSLDNRFILSTIHNSRRYQIYSQCYEVIKYFLHYRVIILSHLSLEAPSFCHLFSLVPFSFSEPVLKNVFQFLKQNSFWICSCFSIRFCSLWRIAYLFSSCYKISFKCVKYLHFLFWNEALFQAIYCFLHISFTIPENELCFPQLFSNLKFKQNLCSLFLRDIIFYFHF